MIDLIKQSGVALSVVCCYLLLVYIKDQMHCLVKQINLTSQKSKRKDTVGV